MQQSFKIFKNSKNYKNILSKVGILFNKLCKNNEEKLRCYINKFKLISVLQSNKIMKEKFFKFLIINSLKKSSLDYLKKYLKRWENLEIVSKNKEKIFNSSMNINKANSILYNLIEERFTFSMKQIKLIQAIIRREKIISRLIINSTNNTLSRYLKKWIFYSFNYRFYYFKNDVFSKKLGSILMKLNKNKLTISLIKWKQIYLEQKQILSNLIKYISKSVNKLTLSSFNVYYLTEKNIDRLKKLVNSRNKVNQFLLIIKKFAHWKKINKMLSNALNFTLLNQVKFMLLRPFL